MGVFSKKPPILVFFYLILPFKIIIVLNFRHHIIEKAPHSIFHNMLKVKFSCLANSSYFMHANKLSRN